MRIREIEKGDGILNRLLIRFISIVSGMRLPDAARIVMYHQDFYGKPMTTWTHAAMRAESNWTIGERELIAAMVAKWNTCPFCVEAHSSISSLELGESIVNSALKDFHQANISAKLQATLEFLEMLIQSPDKLSARDTKNALEKGVTPEALEDAIAIAALFSITVRCANALNFALLNSRDSTLAARRMLKQGYVFGKSNLNGRPDHHAKAEVLLKQILKNPGKTDRTLRQAIAKRTTGGSPLEAPYDELALQIGRGGYGVSDNLVNEVVAKSGSEKAAFELIAAAAVSVGLHYWRRGNKILSEAC